MKNKKKLMLYGVILVVFIFGGVFFANRSSSKEIDQKSAGNTSQKTSIAVKAQEVKTVASAGKLSFKATLEPVEEGIVSSKISGKVVQVLFENGKAVSKGDPLVRLDDQDIRNQLSSAQSQLQASESQLNGAKAGLPKIKANVESAQRNYTRLQTLFSQGAVTQVELENAETSMKAAQSDLASAQANINTLMANVSAARANLNTINDSLANTVIKAPISGVMDEKSVDLGQFASPGAALAKVKNVAVLNAVIQVEQSALKDIKIGQKAQIKLNEDDSKVYEGTVKYIDISANPSARVFNCKIEVTNQGQALRPGIFAKVEINKGEQIQVIQIPMSALMGDEGNYFVFVMENGAARKKDVSVGEITKDTVEIKSGLKPGEQLITTNLNTLQDGDLVTAAGQGA